jgi:hypothetical protein
MFEPSFASIKQAGSKLELVWEWARGQYLSDFLSRRKAPFPNKQMFREKQNMVMGPEGTSRNLQLCFVHS